MGNVCWFNAPCVTRLQFICGVGLWFSWGGSSFLKFAQLSRYTSIDEWWYQEKKRNRVLRCKCMAEMTDMISQEKSAVSCCRWFYWRLIQWGLTNYRSGVKSTKGQEDVHTQKETQKIKKCKGHDMTKGQQVRTQKEIQKIKKIRRPWYVGNLVLMLKINGYKHEWCFEKVIL